MAEITLGSVLIARSDRSEPVEILYTNHRGEFGKRRIIPDCLRLGATEWHPQRQWLLDAWDLDKQAHRSFALSEIREVNGVAVPRLS